MSRFRLRLTTLLIGIIFVALVLALVAQQATAERRERGLRMSLADCEAKRFVMDGMERLLSDPGIDVLKQASDVELLQVSRGPGGQFIGAAHNVVTPTGVMLGESVARRMACVLLDYRNYRHIDANDFPEPRFGLRFHGVSATLDVLLEARTGSTHQDVWIRIHDRAGATVHTTGSGWNCMSDPELQKLAESILAR